MACAGLTSADTYPAPLAFSDVENLETGVFPSAVVIADVDLNGWSDIVVSCRDEGAVQLFLNNGNAVFLAPVSLPCGGAPRIPAVSDVNGDGWPDVVVPDWQVGADRIALILSDGAGGFLASEYLATNAGSRPRAVALADLNGDGDEDLVVANNGADDLTIFENDGTGSFAPVLTIPVGNAPGSLSIADFDNDGLRDIAVTSRLERTTTFVRNLGNNAFEIVATADVGVGPRDEVVADVNGDGRLDVVVSSGTDNTNSGFTVVLNLGAFSMRELAFHEIGHIAHGIDARDFDGDGDRDVLIVNVGSNSAYVMRNNGNGTFAFSPHFLSTGAGLTSPAYCAVGELDGEGGPDIVTANIATNDIGVFRNLTPLPPHGDIDLDGVVGAADLAELIGAWGSPDLLADLDGDGVVTASDLADLIGRWGAQSPK